jgi:hypothetical protein
VFDVLLLTSNPDIICPDFSDIAQECKMCGKIAQLYEGYCEHCEDYVLCDHCGEKVYTDSTFSGLCINCILVNANDETTAKAYFTSCFGSNFTEALRGFCLEDKDHFAEFLEGWGDNK